MAEDNGGGHLDMSNHVEVEKDLTININPKVKIVFVTSRASLLGLLIQMSINCCFLSQPVHDK